MMSFIFGLILVASAQTVNLTQETKDIACNNAQTSVVIDHRDRFLLVREDKVETKYKAVEFLDTGILLLNEKSQKHALIQLSHRGTAVLIIGELTKFLEQQCKDVGASKHCDLGDSRFLTWSSDQFELQIQGKRHSYVVSQYGIHPNDGTYFLARNSDSHGIAILDAGARVLLLQGRAQNLKCTEIN